MKAMRGTLMKIFVVRILIIKSVSEKNVAGSQILTKIWIYQQCRRGQKWAPIIVCRLKDCEDIELVRLRVDIQDLSLGDVSPFLTHQKENVIGLSKHLCGAATDLAIRWGLFSSLILCLILISKIIMVAFKK
jgi:hypothetical protein